jgi:hypothetical protein
MENRFEILKQYGIVLLTSFGGSAISLFVSHVLASAFSSIDLGGDKAVILVPLLFGVPAGTLCGVIYLYRRCFTITKIVILSIISFISIYVTAFLGTVMADKISPISLLFIPFMIPLFPVLIFYFSRKE